MDGGAEDTLQRSAPRLGRCGYVSCESERNQGRWLINGRRHTVWREVRAEPDARSAGGGGRLGPQTRPDDQRDWSVSGRGEMTAASWRWSCVVVVATMSRSFYPFYRGANPL